MAGLATTPVRADEIPSYQVLSCEHDCPTLVEARLLKGSSPEHPFKYRGVEGLYVESLVDVDYTIGTDGTVKNPFVEFLLGPQAFADSALSAIRSRTYSPATEDGKPVEENHRVRFVFSIRDRENVARDEVVKAYERAIHMARDQKIDDAIAGLNAIAAQTLLDFYERTMVGYALATLEGQQGNVWAARDAIRTATIDDAKYLDPRTRLDAIRLRIVLEAATGEFSDAFAWYDILQKRVTLEADDTSTKLVAKLHAALDGAGPLVIDAQTAAKGTPAIWQHTLLRRSFEFKQVTGTLDHFDLNCARHSIRSAVSTVANWTVPQSWPDCVISVFGDPGIKFQFVEYRPTAK